MKRLWPLVATLRHIAADRRGATAVEYALVVAAIMLAIFAGLQQIGVSLNGVARFLAGQLRIDTR